MKLYFSKGACSLAVRIIINEMGLPCDYEAVDLQSKKTASGTDFLSINPKGAVPTLITSQGHCLTENNVIQQFLADDAKAVSLLPPIGDFNRYRVLEWMNFIATDLHKACSPLFNPDVPAEVKENIFAPLLKKRSSFVNQALSSSAFIAADHFTLPDAYLFVVTRWLPHFSIDIKQWPHLADYFQRMLSRAAVKKSLVEEGLA